MTVLIQEAVLPALERLDWHHLEMPRSEGVVVPLAGPAPTAAAFLIMVETDDETGEALVHAGLCTVPPARRAPVALLLAEINTRYRFVTFSMGHDGEVRVDVGVELAAVVTEMRPAVVEVALRRLAHAVWSAYAEVLQAAIGRGRRPRVVREVDAVLRNMEQKEGRDADTPGGNGANSRGEA